MQDNSMISRFGITLADCQWGVILLDSHDWGKRWQGTAAIEEIVRLLPLGESFVAAYRIIPGLKWIGDRSYEQIRDHRYDWFGQRTMPHNTPYPVGCMQEESSVKFVPLQKN
jgi:predicted DCC family thiol-disulfide oxidoreductase YuxK